MTKNLAEARLQIIVAATSLQKLPFYRIECRSPCIFPELIRCKFLPYSRQRPGDDSLPLGLYANAHRGKINKAAVSPSYPPIIEDETSFVPSRGWAEMIKKIYEVDPLLCPLCVGQMSIISFIEVFLEAGNCL